MKSVGMTHIAIVRGRRGKGLRAKAVKRRKHDLTQNQTGGSKPAGAALDPCT